MDTEPTDPINPNAIDNLVDGIEEKARGESSFHVGIFNPDGWGVDPEKEKEFTDRENLEAWKEEQPEQDAIIVIQYTGDPPPEPDEM